MTTALSNYGVVFGDNTEQKTALVKGIILFWSGNIIDMPAGWQLCDGTNGTPDLRDRFVVCAGDLYTVGATGGEDTVSISAPQLPVHTHTITVSAVSPAGSHNHGGSFASSVGAWPHTHTITPSPVSTATSPNNYSTSPAAGQFGDVSRTQPSGNHSHPYSISPAGAHEHGAGTISVGNAGAGDPHENRPPYYALAFIMEVGNVN